MRTILWLALGLALSWPCYGQQKSEYSYWKLYEVKSGQWLYQLSRDLKSQGVKIKSLNHLVGEILKKNPQIKNKDKIKVGAKILVPFNLPKNHEVPRFPSSQVVNYHIYHNSTVYHGAGPAPVVEQGQSPEEPKKLEVVRVRKPAQQGTLRQEVNEPWGLNFKVDPHFGFTQLDSTETSDGSQASLASATSFGLALSARHEIFWDLDMIYKASFASDSFIAPETAVQAVNLNQQYFGGALGVGYKPMIGFDTSLLVGYEQAPYISANATQISIAKVNHPSVRLSGDYEFLTDMHLLANFGFLTSGSSDGIEVDSVVSFGLGAAYSWNIWDQNFLLGLSYDNQSAKTQATEQTSQAVRFLIGWDVDL